MEIRELLKGIGIMVASWFFPIFFIIWLILRMIEAILNQHWNWLHRLEHTNL